MFGKYTVVLFVLNHSMPRRNVTARSIGLLKDTVESINLVRVKYIKFLV